MKKQKNENVSYLSEVLDKLKEHKMATLPFLQLREERTSLELMLSGVMFLPV